MPIAQLAYAMHHALNKLLPSAPAPASENASQTTTFLKECYAVISEHIGMTTAADLINDHATTNIYGEAHATTNNIKEDYWKSSATGQPAALMRSILTIGPAKFYCPDYYIRNNQGILCEPSCHNHDKTPIELLGHTYIMVLKQAGGTPSSDEVFDNLVQLFTSTDVQNNPTVDNMVIYFVKGTSKKEQIKGTRLDIINTLRLVYIIGYIVFLSNPLDLKHYHPLHVIQRIFLAQAKFFTPNHDLEAPLSDTEKHNYLFSLGFAVYESLRITFDAAIYINNAELFPASTSLTNMPPPLALGYVSGHHAPGLPSLGHAQHADADADDAVHQTRYFLFGQNANEGETDDDLLDAYAQPLDADVLELYKDIQLKQLSGYENNNLLNLVIMICPKVLGKDGHPIKGRQFGLKTKKDIIAYINKHADNFHATHNLDPYIHELETMD